MAELTVEKLTEELSEAQFAEIERVVATGEFSSVDAVISKFTHEGRNNSADRIFDRFFNRGDDTVILREHTAFLFVWRDAMENNKRGVDFSSFLAKVDDAIENAYLSDNPRAAYLNITRRLTKYAQDKGVYPPRRAADPTDVVGGGDEEPF